MRSWRSTSRSIAAILAFFTRSAGRFTVTFTRSVVVAMAAPVSPYVRPYCSRPRAMSSGLRAESLGESAGLARACAVGGHPTIELRAAHHDPAAEPVVWHRRGHRGLGVAWERRTHQVLAELADADACVARERLEREVRVQRHRGR